MRLASLLLKLLRNRMAAAILVALATAVCLAASVSASAVRAQFERTVVDSVVDAHGRESFVIQAVDPALNSEIEALGLYQKLWRYPSDASSAHGDALTDVLVVSDEALDVSELIAGRHPRSRGEVAVSSGLATALRLTVSDRMRFDLDGPTTGKVVGITIDAALKDALTLQTIGTVPGAPVTWVGQESPFTQESLIPALERGQVTARTVQLVAEDQAAAETRRVFGPLRYLDRVLLYAAWFLLSWILLILGWRLSPDLRALRAIGMSIERSAALALAAGAAALAVGCVLAVPLLLLASETAYESVGDHYGQVWTELPTPLGQLARQSFALVAVCLTTTGAVWAAVTLWNQRAAGRYSRQRFVGPVIVIYCVFMGAATVLVVLVALSGELQFPTAPTAITMTTSLLVLGARVATREGRTRAFNRVMQTARAAVAPLALVVGGISFLGVFYTSSLEDRALSEMENYAVNQPSGSLLINQVGPQVAEQVSARYLEAGGAKTTVLSLPLEVANTVRVTSPRAIDCAADRQLTRFNEIFRQCSDVNARTPINSIALSNVVSVDAAMGDPEIMVDGDLGVIDIDLGTVGVRSAAKESISGSNAELGGLLPGLIVHPNGPIAEKYGLRPSSTRLVVLHQFDELSEPDKAAMRKYVRTVSSGGQQSEDAVPSEIVDRRDRARTSGYTLGFVLALIGVVAAGVAATRASRAWSQMGVLGLGSRLKHAGAISSTSPLLLSATGSSLAGYVTAWIVGGTASPPLGSAWIACLAGGLVMWTAAWITTLRNAVPALTD